MKYELINHDGSKAPNRFKQIRALRDIPVFGVEKGDLGGFVESEKNLSQDGDCWVSDDARVSGNAQVYGTARVSDNAWVYGNARVSDFAWVSGTARVSGTAWVSDSAHVSDAAVVYGDAQVSDNAMVSDSAEVSTGQIAKTSQIAYAGTSQYDITVSPWWVRIGCECMPRKEWDERIEELAEEHEESVDDIRKWLKIADALRECVEEQ